MQLIVLIKKMLIYEAHSDNECSVFLSLKMLITKSLQHVYKIKNVHMNHIRNFQYFVIVFVTLHVYITVHRY